MDTKRIRKDQKMKQRLQRGILREGEKNSGKPNSSKLNPNCQWAKNREPARGW